MTHNNIYTKFLIEYDKADVTSSYPSLTKYEVATILDKAYLALIGQKMTGNNVRRSAFETDVKSISDLQNLIKTSTLRNPSDNYNVRIYDLPSDFLYFVQLSTLSGSRKLQDRIDGLSSHSGIPNFARLIDHNTAEKFITTDKNIPWVKNPVCFIEDDKINVIGDPYLMLDTWKDKKSSDTTMWHSVDITYIKRPKKFARDNNTVDLDSDFELNDQMAEELISLAVSFALENVESQRLNTKLNTRGLEA